MKEKSSQTDLVLFTPEEDIEIERPLDGLLLPSFYYLNMGGGTGLIGLPTSVDEDFITVALPYKVEMVRDREDMYTRLRLFYPKPSINLHKSNIIYSAEPMPSAEYRYMSVLLCDRKRDLQRTIYDLGLDPESNVEYFKQRKIELESKAVKH